MDIQLQFIDSDNAHTCVLVSFPAVPRFGDKVQFVDSDEGIELKGVVREVLYQDADGEVAIVVAIDQFS